MICQHVSTKTARPGNTDICVLCGIDIIYYSERWVWTQSLDSDLVRRLRAEHQELRRIGGTA